MKLKVQLEVTLDVDEELLEENGESTDPEFLANAIYVAVPSGSFLSVMDEAVEPTGQTVKSFCRIKES
jgi:hypothetical protein